MPRSTFSEIVIRLRSVGLPATAIATILRIPPAHYHVYAWRCRGPGDRPIKPSAGEAAQLGRAAQQRLVGALLNPGPLRPDDAMYLIGTAGNLVQMRERMGQLIATGRTTYDAIAWMAHLLQKEEARQATAA
jgi:hypothetical protein